MKCKKNVERIEEICGELMGIIDDSRAHCESDECELIHCVVHDCVQQMRRVVAQWNPETPVGSGAGPPEGLERADRSVN
jgi:hypothetical protein